MPGTHGFGYGIKDPRKKKGKKKVKAKKQKKGKNPFAAFGRG